MPKGMREQQRKAVIEEVQAGSSDTAYKVETKPTPAPEQPAPKSEDKPAPQVEDSKEENEPKVAEKPQDSSLAAEMNKVIADTFTLYLTAHGFHWNIRGDEFAQNHEFFEEIYEDVWSSIDAWAENVRKIQDTPIFRLEDIMKTREVKDAPAGLTKAPEMFKALLEMNEKVIECLNETFAAATKANEQGIANFAAERIDQHQKWAWQLRSSLGEE